jgi:hypothetical protein
VYIGSEQTWAVTSVDSSQDIQVLNRQVPINVDDSREMTSRVNKRTIERYGKAEVQYPEDEDVLVCRAMFHLLREEGMINVIVPFHSRIEWLDNTNRRNVSLFMDMVIAFTGMFRYQRERDADGYYLATEKDFMAARKLFSDDGGNAAEELVHRLTSKEREVAKIINDNSEGVTREEIAGKLNPPVTSQRVGQIIHGENGKGGLMQKFPIETKKIADTIKINDDHKRTSYRTLYFLKGFNPLEGFDSVVKLLTDSDERARKDEERGEER